MKKLANIVESRVAEIVSKVLENIAGYFAKTASPLSMHRPNLPDELE